MRNQFIIFMVLIGSALFFSTECFAEELSAKESTLSPLTDSPVTSETIQDSKTSQTTEIFNIVKESEINQNKNSEDRIEKESQHQETDVVKANSEAPFETISLEDEILGLKQLLQNHYVFVSAGQENIEHLSNSDIFLPSHFYFSFNNKEKVFVLASLRSDDTSEMSQTDSINMGLYLDDDLDTPITENADESLANLDEEEVVEEDELLEGVSKEVNLSIFEDDSLEKEESNELNAGISPDSDDSETEEKPALKSQTVKDATDLALAKEDSVETDKGISESKEKSGKTVVQFGSEKTDILDTLIFDLIREIQWGEPKDYVSFSPVININKAYAELAALRTEKGTLVPQITVYQNRKVRAFIKMYTHRKRYVLIKAVERYANYKNMIHRIFIEYGVPLNLAYLAIVESNLNPKARSTANALGLWQFMSYTGKAFNLERSWWHDDRYDAEKSTVAAARYLKRLNRQFKGDWELALAAYNSGSGTVRRAIRRNKRRGKPTDFWSLKLPRETRGYVPAFYAVATIFQDLDKYGFEPIPALVDEVEKKHLSVAGGIALKDVANVLKVDLSELKNLNPSLKSGGLSPATYETFQIAIPVQTNISLAQITKLNTLSLHPHDSWKTHVVRSGESLWSISRKYRVPVRKIIQFNRIKRRTLINIGQRLMLPIPKNWKPPVIRPKIEIVKDKLDKLPGLTLVYTIKKGDSLWKIATMFQIPLSKIKKWNRALLRRRFLKIGSDIVLKLPIPETESST